MDHITYSAASADSSSGGGSESQAAATFTVIVEYDQEWSASVHRKDGSLITAIAGGSAHDVLIGAAVAIDKAVAA